MTSWHSLLACSQADVTIERIAALAATTGTEPLTVDFKEKATPRIAEGVAAMANATGGLVLAGITDTDREIVGVKTETLSHVADMLATRLDPADWLPEMFEVAIGDDAPGRYVLVIRIRPELAPRPVMVQRTGPGGDGIFWAPVRIPGGTRQATRAELAALFAGPGPGRSMPADGWEFDAPQFPVSADGMPDAEIDMMLKTGLSVTPGAGMRGQAAVGDRHHQPGRRTGQVAAGRDALHAHRPAQRRALQHQSPRQAEYLRHRDADLADCRRRDRTVRDHRQDRGTWAVRSLTHPEADHLPGDHKPT